MDENMNQQGDYQQQYQQAQYQQGDYQQQYQQAGYQQPMYQQPVYQPYAQDTEVSVGDWIVTMILCCIPIVNIIMLFVWAFSGGTKDSKSNWAKAQLIMFLIGIVLVIVICAVTGATLLSIL